MHTKQKRNRKDVRQSGKRQKTIHLTKDRKWLCEKDTSVVTLFICVTSASATEMCRTTISWIECDKQRQTEASCYQIETAELDKLSCIFPRGYQHIVELGAVVQKAHHRDMISSVVAPDTKEENKCWCFPSTERISSSDFGPISFPGIRVRTVPFFSTLDLRLKPLRSVWLPPLSDR